MLGKIHVQEECIYTRFWPVIDSSFKFTSFRAIGYFRPTHPRLYIASFHLRSMPHRHGSYLALGHESRPVPGLLASVLGPASHVTATNVLMFTVDVIST